MFKKLALTTAIASATITVPAQADTFSYGESTYKGDYGSTEDALEGTAIKWEIARAGQRGYYIKGQFLEGVDSLTTMDTYTVGVTNGLGMPGFKYFGESRSLLGINIGIGWTDTYISNEDLPADNQVFNDGISTREDDLGFSLEAGLHMNIKAFKISYDYTYMGDFGTTSTVSLGVSF